jgi:hypothetical protein
MLASISCLFAHISIVSASLRLPLPWLSATDSRDLFLRHKSISHSPRAQLEKHPQKRLKLPGNGKKLPQNAHFLPPFFSHSL